MCQFPVSSPESEYTYPDHSTATHSLNAICTRLRHASAAIAYVPDKEIFTTAPNSIAPHHLFFVSPHDRHAILLFGFDSEITPHHRHGEKFPWRNVFTSRLAPSRPGNTRCTHAPRTVLTQRKLSQLLHVAVLSKKSANWHGVVSLKMLLACGFNSGQVLQKLAQQL